MTCSELKYHKQISRNLAHNKTISYEEKELKDVGKMAVILFQPQCVKLYCVTDISSFKSKTRKVNSMPICAHFLSLAQSKLNYVVNWITTK